MNSSSLDIFTFCVAFLFTFRISFSVSSFFIISFYIRFLIFWTFFTLFITFGTTFSISFGILFVIFFFIFGRCFSSFGSRRFWNFLFIICFTWSFVIGCFLIFCWTFIIARIIAALLIGFCSSWTILSRLLIFSTGIIFVGRT